MKGMPLFMTRPKKQRVPATSQIGVIQTAILEWLLAQEEEIEAYGSEEEKLVLAARGVPWNVKRFCKSCKRAYKDDGSPDSSKISTSLRQLEVKKGLVQRHGHRTSYVKLTERGRLQAKARRDDPRSWQEKRAAERARRRAHAIAYELYRYGDQMSKLDWHIGRARQAFYLHELSCLGQISSYEAIELEKALEQLRGEEFKRLLPQILQNSMLPSEHYQEIKMLKLQLLD